MKITNSNSTLEEKVKIKRTIILAFVIFVTVFSNAVAKKISDIELDPYDDKKMKGENRSFKDKMLNLNKFQKIDSFTLYVKPLIGKFGKRNAEFVYRDGTDIGGFVCYYDTSAYAIQFAQDARQKLIVAAEQYLKDFEVQNLKKRAKRTDMVYGHCDGYEDYGIVKGSMRYYAKPTIYFGYLFEKDNPYFVIYVQEAENLSPEKKPSEDKIRATAIAQHYCFTRPQLKKLIAFLGDENINSLNTNLNEDDDDEIGVYKETEEN